MDQPSPLRRAYDGMGKLPDSTRSRLLGLMFTRTVKFAGTCGIRFDDVKPERVVISMKNRRKLRNHIGGIHAAAMAMIGETATGAVLGLNLPAGKVPLIKHLEVDFTRRCQGDLSAEATLTPEQLQRIADNERGEVDIAVTITDSENKQPVKARMIWAWIPTRR